jgi:hypothetical protein
VCSCESSKRFVFASGQQAASAAVGASISSCLIQISGLSLNNADDQWLFLPLDKIPLIA